VAIDFDPLVSHADPYPIYRRLRDEAPVHHNEARRVWSVTRFDDGAKPQVIEVPESALTPISFEENEAVSPPDVIYRSGMTMADVERATIEAALREYQGNRRQAAARLGIGERTLYRKIKEFNLA